MTIAFEPTRLDGVIELVIGSDNLQDLCKRIVHADFAAGLVKGAHLYLLDSRSNLQATAGYGVNEIAEQTELSAWGDTAEAEAVRSKQLVTTGQQSCVPLIKDSIPLGCLSLWHTKQLSASPVSADIAVTLGKLVAFFIEAQGTGANNRQTVRAEGSIDDMTTRQLQILALMADGLTNAEIALKVLLSESTVRQETIRIYRALGVGTRQEAVAKGRAIGLIAKSPPA